GGGAVVPAEQQDADEADQAQTRHAPGRGKVRERAEGDDGVLATHDIEAPIEQGVRLVERERVGHPELRLQVRRDQGHDQHRAPPVGDDALHATGLVTRPTPGISTSTTSPLRRGPTPEGVPVAMRSPGSSVMIELMYSMSTGIEKAISDARPCCRTSPFTLQITSRLAGSMPSAATGVPTGQKVSKPFARVHWSSFRCRSLAVT